MFGCEERAEKFGSRMLLLSEAAVRVPGSASVGYDFFDISGVSSCITAFENDVIYSDVSCGVSTLN